MSNVGKLIRLTRQVKGQTTGGLASIIGRSESHLNDIENGMLHGTPETLLAVADRLDISPLVMRDAYVQDATERALIQWDGKIIVKPSVKNKTAI